MYHHVGKTGRNVFEGRYLHSKFSYLHMEGPFVLVPYTIEYCIVELQNVVQQSLWSFYISVKGAALQLSSWYTVHCKYELPLARSRHDFSARDKQN
jgi:hypothetical protein